MVGLFGRGEVTNVVRKMYSVTAICTRQSLTLCSHGNAKDMAAALSILHLATVSSDFQSSYKHNGCK